MTPSDFDARALLCAVVLLLHGCGEPRARRPAPPAAAIAPCDAPWQVALDEVLPTEAHLDDRVAPVMWVSPVTGDVSVVVAEPAEGGGARTSAVWISETPGRWRARGGRLDFAQEPVAIAGDYFAVGQTGYRDESALDVRVFRYDGGAWRPFDRLRHVSVASAGLGLDEAGRLSGFFGDDRGDGELRHRSADGAWTRIDELDGVAAAALTPRGFARVDADGLTYREPPAAGELVTAAPGAIDAIVLARSGPAALAIQTRGAGHIVAYVRSAGGWRRHPLVDNPPRRPWPSDCELDCPPSRYTTYSLGAIAARDGQPLVVLVRSEMRAVRTMIHGSTGSHLTERAASVATSLVVADLVRGSLDEVALARPLRPTRLAIATGPTGVVHLLAEEAPSSLRHLILTCARQRGTRTALHEVECGGLGRMNTALRCLSSATRSGIIDAAHEAR